MHPCVIRPVATVRHWDAERGPLVTVKDTADMAAIVLRVLYRVSVRWNTGFGDILAHVRGEGDRSAPLQCPAFGQYDGMTISVAEA